MSIFHNSIECVDDIRVNNNDERIERKFSSVVLNYTK